MLLSKGHDGWLEIEMLYRGYKLSCIHGIFDLLTNLLMKQMLMSVANVQLYKEGAMNILFLL